MGRIWREWPALNQIPGQLEHCYQPENLEARMIRTDQELTRAFHSLTQDFRLGQGFHTILYYII